MPSKNVIRELAADNYYHVYNRGAAKQLIFVDAVDKQKFMGILERHLDPTNIAVRYDGVPYRKFDKDLELLGYCLMGNHFHLLLYLKGSAAAFSGFMQSVSTAYAMYFNKRHKRVGALFQGVFRAALISQNSYLQHITRYIHLNPRNYKRYRYSSLPYYLGEQTPAWLKPQRVIETIEGTDYREFLEDYEDQKAVWDEIKQELADQ